MTRRLVFVVLLAVVLVAGVFTTAWGRQRIRLIVNGAEVYPEVPPQIIGGRTMVPL
ncbi:MAG: copper amine oxidase N-terminal domain-containing protein, partial [Thermoleophilia bacterium]|nr:copper amine oxidase N-terminal domain-containing protein [Thermoleophilia bacterium]